MARKNAPIERDGGTRLSADLVFELLANKNRRMILRNLLQRGETTNVENLVTESLAPLDGESLDVDTARTRLLARFRHAHLPKLTDAGVIEYWPQMGLVEPMPIIDEFRPFLELAEPFERPLDSAL